MKDRERKRLFMQMRSAIIAFCAISFMLVGSTLAQDVYTAPDVVKEYTIGVIEFVKSDATWVRIKIRETKNGWLTVKRLKVERLYDGDEGHRRYGFTGPPGTYLVEVMYGQSDGGPPIDEEFQITIEGDENGPDPPNPDDDPDDDDPDDDDPDNPDDDDPAPDDEWPTDEYNNIGRRIRAEMPNSLRAEFASEFEETIRLMDEPGGIMRVSDAKERVNEFLRRYDSRGWQAVNDIIREDGNNRRFSFQGAIDYYTTIHEAVKP